MVASARGFRGASADAVHALRERVDGLGSSSADAAGDLFAVADTVRAEGTLRRFATDASLPSEARSGLVQQVFGGKVGDEALALVQDAAGRRWTANRDLADALEHLGVVAVARSAGDRSGQLVDEVFAVGELVRDDHGLRDALADPRRSRADKAGLLDAVLGGKVLDATLVLVQQALSGSYRTVGAALEDYEKVVASVHGEGVATVRTAQPLSDAELDRLQRALGAQYGRSVHLNVVVEPALLGGLRVEIGDDVIDGTVASRLDEARRRLAG